MNRVAGAWCAMVSAALVALTTSRTVSGDMGCERLVSLKLPDTTITIATSVAAGEPVLSGAARAGRDARASQLPAFCRVGATVKPSPDSDIKLEVWLPTSGWNGKFQAVGNGSWGGTISYPAMSAALEHGYATTSTDTGHTGASAQFALGHPEKLIDYAYRSEHVMTVTAKAIIDAYYGRAPTLSYFNGCSTGGRQAIVEAQRFPDDYDGIIAGAAANPKTHLDAWRIWLGQVMFKDPASTIPASKFPIIHQAVLAQCDAIDGLKDGLIDDPTRCHFDAHVLACKAGDEPSCLTAAQVRAATLIMSPARDSRTGVEIFPGFEAGNELGWTQMLGGTDPYGTAQDQFRYVTFSDPGWNWRTFDLERDVAIADKNSEGTLAAVDPDLSVFARHGGKLLMYHGWSDPNIAPRASINFYRHVLEMTKGAKEPDWLRLFMVPGMGHCSGGEGPNTFDMMSAMELWVEKHEPPARILASHFTAGKIDRTRPLCAYPRVARYSGSGSVDDAANFVCKAP